MQADDGDISSSLCLVPTSLPASEAVKPLLSTTSRWWSGALERLPIYNNINMDQNIQTLSLGQTSRQTLRNWIGNNVLVVL